MELEHKGLLGHVDEQYGDPDGELEQGRYLWLKSLLTLAQDGSRSRAQGVKGA